MEDRGGGGLSHLRLFPIGTLDSLLGRRDSIEAVQAGTPRQLLAVSGTSSVR